MIGLFISIFLVISKIIDFNLPLTNRPVFYMGLTSLILGMQLFLAGFLGELISRNAPGRNSYIIEKKAGL